MDEIKNVAGIRIVTREAQAEVYCFLFKQVCGETDWKGPVHAWVPWSMADVYMEAIMFMTGSTPMCHGLVTLESGREICLLTADGYRAFVEE